jgi:hypothetical protein
MRRLEEREGATGGPHFSASEGKRKREREMLGRQVGSVGRAEREQASGLKERGRGLGGSVFFPKTFQTFSNF